MKKFIGLTLAILLGTSSFAFALVLNSVPEAVPVVQGVQLPAKEGTPCPCNVFPVQLKTAAMVAEEKRLEAYLQTVPEVNAPAEPTTKTGTDSHQ